MKTIATCAEVAQARLLRSVLEGHGIEALIPDEQTSEIVPHWVWGQGGVRVQVAESDAKAAQDVLATFESEEPVGFDTES